MFFFGQCTVPAFIQEPEQGIGMVPRAAVVRKGIVLIQHPEQTLVMEMQPDMLEVSFYSSVIDLMGHPAVDEKDISGHGRIYRTVQHKIGFSGEDQQDLPFGMGFLKPLIRSRFQLGNLGFVIAAAEFCSCAENGFLSVHVADDPFRASL